MLNEIGGCMWWTISIVVYLAIAASLFKAMYSVNEDLKNRKHYKSHPERYGVSPVWILVVVSVLWPIQVIGLMFYAMKG